MIRKALITGALLLASVIGTAQRSSIIKKAHSTSYHTSQETVLSHVLCSATAVGPHALLTATHCELGTDDIDVEGIKNTLHIDGHIRDGHDHTIYLIDGTTFPTFSTVDLNDDAVQGDEVFIFGNPGNWSDLYRHGYIAGVLSHDSFSGSSPLELLVDIKTYHGDSGAAIFNDNGDVIGIVTGAEVQTQGDDSMELTASYMFAFKPDDIEKARSFGVTKQGK